MQELESAVDSASRGDYTGLTRIQEALLDPEQYLAFSNALFESLQSKDIFVFHGLNLLVTAGTYKNSLYCSLKAYIFRLIDVGRTLLATGIAMKTLSKLIICVVAACFSPNEVCSFCTMLISQHFTEVPFLLNVVEDFMLHMARTTTHSTANNSPVLSSIIELTNQVIESMNHLIDMYSTSCFVANSTENNYQGLMLAYLKILTIAVKWEALTKVCPVAPNNSDDAFFVTQARPLPGLLHLLGPASYNNIAKLLLLTLLRSDILVHSCCQELLTALATVTYKKVETTSIAFMFFVAILLRFYQFQLSTGNKKAILSELEAATLTLNLDKCIFGSHDTENNLLAIAGNFFYSNVWIDIPRDPVDDFFPIQVVQSLILANGSVTILSVLNNNQITRLIYQFLFTLFFVHMSVSQELDFIISYLDSLMSIVHTSYQACLIGPSFNLVSADDAQNSTLIAVLRSFLLATYSNTSSGLYISQIQTYIAKCLDLMINKGPTPRNMRQYNVQNCSDDCIQVIRDFSIDLYTIIRYCCLPDNRDSIQFNFIKFCQDNAIFERIRDSNTLSLTDQNKLDINLATVIFNSALFFGIRDELFSINEEEFVSAQPIYLCMASTEMLISQQCYLASTAIHLIARGLSGECDWNTAIKACFETQVAIQWVRYLLYDSEDVASYSECLNATSQDVLSEAIVDALKSMSNINEVPGHINLSSLFLNDAVISTILLCIDVMNITKKRPAFPVNTIVRVIKRLDILCREVPVSSTCDFTNFLLRYRRNILTFSRFLIEHVAPKEITLLITYTDSIISMVATTTTAIDHELTTNPNLVMENVILLLSLSAGGLAALEKMSINDCNRLKSTFLDKIFTAYAMIFPYLEALPNGTAYILATMFLARDILLFVESTIDRWLKYIGSQVISFFKQLIDSSFGLLYRGLQATMNWAGISSERCTSLHHVYSGEDVTSVAFSGQEQLYLIFLAASAITIDVLYEITNYIPSLLILRSDEHKEFTYHVVMSILTTIIKFTPILDRVDDHDITKIINMFAILLNFGKDSLGQEEATNIITALCAFLDNLPHKYVLLKIKLFDCIVAFSNALLRLYSHSNQLEHVNQIHMQIIEKSINKLIYCAFLDTKDADIASDLADALFHVVFVSIENISKEGMQFRQDSLRFQILEAIQTLNVQECAPLVNSTFLNIKRITTEDSRSYNAITSIRELLFAIHAACIKRAATQGLSCM